VAPSGLMIGTGGSDRPGPPVYSSRRTFHPARMASLPTAGRLLALDWGERRIGLALSDESQTLATPLETLIRRPGKRLPMPRLLSLVREHHPVGLVIGLPLTPEGGESESTEAAREMGRVVAERTGLPLALWDERLSTARALGAIRETGGSTRGRRADVDALAAAVVLQGYLDHARGGTT